MLTTPEITVLGKRVNSNVKEVARRRNICCTLEETLCNGGSAEFKAMNVKVGNADGSGLTMRTFCFTSPSQSHPPARGTAALLYKTSSSCLDSLFIETPGCCVDPSA
jgi:hypothetical protein